MARVFIRIITVIMIQIYEHGIKTSVWWKRIPVQCTSTTCGILQAEPAFPHFPPFSVFFFSVGRFRSSSACPVGLVIFLLSMREVFVTTQKARCLGGNAHRGTRWHSMQRSGVSFYSQSSFNQSINQSLFTTLKNVYRHKGNKKGFKKRCDE